MRIKYLGKIASIKLQTASFHAAVSYRSVDSSFHLILDPRVEQIHNGAMIPEVVVCTGVIV